MAARKNKYGNKQVEIDGILFDSKKEGYYYLYLLDRLKKNEIIGLRRQVEFELVPPVYEKRIKHFKTKPDEEEFVEIQKPIKYIADFVYVDAATGKEVVVDVKSDATRKDKVYVLKKKMMLAFEGIRIQEE